MSQIILQICLQIAYQVTVSQKCLENVICSLQKSSFSSFRQVNNSNNNANYYQPLIKIKVKFGYHLSSLFCRYYFSPTHGWKSKYFITGKMSFISPSHFKLISTASTDQEFNISLNIVIDCLLNPCLNIYLLFIRHPKIYLSEPTPIRNLHNNLVAWMFLKGNRCSMTTVLCKFCFYSHLVML